MALLLALLALTDVGWAQARQVRSFDAEKDIQVSCRIETLDGDVLFDWDGETPRVLASNTKLLTTAAALLALPADYRWQTTLLLDGERLTLVGAGDPSLRRLPGRDVPAEFLDSLAQAMREARLGHVKTLVLDPRHFGPAQRHPLWPEEQWHRTYAAGFAALSVEGGLLEVSIEDGAVSTFPSLGEHLKIERKLTRDANLFTAYWLQEDRLLRVNGGSRKPRSESLAVRDPVLIFRSWLIHGLEQRGIEVADVIIAGPGEVDPKGEVLWTFDSAWTLAEAVAVANLDSDNFVSEALLKTLGRVRFGVGDYARGIRAVREILAETGMSLDGLDQTDGSGFARHPRNRANLASPALICELLRKMAEYPEGQLLFDSLPIAEHNSRLSAYFSDPVFSPQRVHAKTGWITGASSLSGYLLTVDDTPLVFSLVVNYVKDNTPRTHNSRFRRLQAAVLAEVLRQRSQPEGVKE
ncbi:MAG: D-alanyl-D-alanine carboxypeptidase/D-alanyl-D-alanine-endopeptidase [Planctomycetes bacterium]|nr:D-alanyl-D-alanine carboxypeptidase/D-alanyl-D-alanine-endopeptidase [Planctomycetota bacterium]